jgi:soluble lytic murein transglycosylase-like protein
MIKVYQQFIQQDMLMGINRSVKARFFSRVALLFCVSFYAASAEAQIYKYRLPNGKILFTDKEVYDKSYTLLTPNALGLEFTKPKHSSGKDRSSKFQKYISKAASKYGIEETLIKAIIKAESDFDPNAVSKAGAQGLMQLMPKTARSYNVNNSFNSRQNIEAGTKHIKYLLGKYKSNLKLALAAYNAGETAVNKYGGIPPFPETQRYVKKVMKFKTDFEKKP